MWGVTPSSCVSFSLAWRPEVFCFPRRIVQTLALLLRQRNGRHE
jgi:hypothetical protein